MVTIVNDFGLRTGIGRYTNDIGKALEHNGKIYSLVYSKDKLNNNYPGTKIKGIYPPFLSSGWVLNFRFQQIGFREFVKQIRLSDDRVHFSNIGIKPFTINERTSVTLFDLIFLKKEFVGEKRKMHYTRYLNKYKNVKKVMTISNYVKRDLENEGFTGDVEVIYPPVSEKFKPVNTKAAIRRRMGLPLDKKLVLSVSTAEFRKNLKAVAETVSLLGENFALVRVGNGLDNCYKFSNLTDEGLNDIYNACDVLLFPTLEEGFGYPVAEAFASGLPVVASNIEVIREVAGDSAILVDPTPTDCVKGIRDAISDEDNLISKGIERSKLFSFEIFKREVVNFFKD